MNYWEKRYQENSTGWDIGYPTPALTQYFDSLDNKDTNILIPGCGNAYEAEYLHRNGFTNVFLLDIAQSPLENFKNRLPDFPEKHLIYGDFFDHYHSYDLILEQTFFCAIPPEQRKAYAEKAHDLLKPQGLLVGLLWAEELNKDQPPFGGSKQEYDTYFQPHFDYLQFDLSEASIPQRANREFFIELKKKTKP